MRYTTLYLMLAPVCGRDIHPPSQHRYWCCSLSLGSMRFSSFSIWGGLASLAAGESTFSPARPPSLPLAVKSPYLSTWFPAGKNGGNGGYLPGQWPTFYTYVGRSFPSSLRLTSAQWSDCRMDWAHPRRQQDLHVAWCARSRQRSCKPDRLRVHQFQEHLHH
jgi:hypothetical protein